MPSDRGRTEGDGDEDDLHDNANPRQMESGVDRGPCQLVEEAEARSDEESDEEGSSSGSGAEEPEWMSFATPEGGLLTNFEELWSQCEQDDGGDGAAGSGSALEPEVPATIEMTSEAICKFVQQEIARALKDAERDRTQGSQAVPLRRGQAPPSRRPKRGERGDLVAEWARQGAAVASSTLAQPVAQRLGQRFQNAGKSVARAGSAMQDAGRLAREAGAVVACRAHGHANVGTPPPAPPPEACRTKPVYTIDQDAQKAKIKVVHAANAVKSKMLQSKMLQKMPKGLPLRRRRKDEEGIVI